MDRDTLDHAAAALPVFPLPRIVLMPRDLLPLHVFEPRYRALVTEVTQTTDTLHGHEVSRHSPSVPQ